MDEVVCGILFGLDYKLTQLLTKHPRWQSNHNADENVSDCSQYGKNLLKLIIVGTDTTKE